MNVEEASETLSVSKQYKTAQKQAEEFCKLNSTDHINHHIQEFENNKTDVGAQKVAHFLRIAKLKKDIQSRNKILKNQNVNKTWNLRIYKNIGCVHYDVNSVTDVTGCCKVTKDRIKTTLINFIKDMDYLFSIQEDADIKIYFELDMLRTLISVEDWDDELVNNLDKMVKEIDKYMEKLMEKYDS